LRNRLGGVNPAESRGKRGVLRGPQASDMTVDDLKGRKAAKSSCSRLIRSGEESRGLGRRGQGAGAFYPGRKENCRRSSGAAPAEETAISMVGKKGARSAGVCVDAQVWTEGTEKWKGGIDHGTPIRKTPNGRCMETRPRRAGSLKNGGASGR